jgi:hypothetical protein
VNHTLPLKSAIVVLLSLFTITGTAFAANCSNPLILQGQGSSLEPPINQNNPVSIGSAIPIQPAPIYATFVPSQLSIPPGCQISKIVYSYSLNASWEVTATDGNLNTTGFNFQGTGFQQVRASVVQNSRGTNVTYPRVNYESGSLTLVAKPISVTLNGTVARKGYIYAALNIVNPTATISFTAVPTPVPTPTPISTPAPTPVPTPISTPRPTPTAITTPVPTDDQKPTPVITQAPTTPTPVPTPKPISSILNFLLN